MKKFVMAVGLLTLAGCANNQQPTNLSSEWLDGTRWYMTGEHYNIADIRLPAFTLSTEEGVLQFNGTTGCNNFFGKAKIEDDRLMMDGPFGMSKKLCSDPSDTIEREFLKAMDDGLRFSEGELFLDYGPRFVQVPKG